MRRWVSGLGLRRRPAPAPRGVQQLRRRRRQPAPPTATTTPTTAPTTVAADTTAPATTARRHLGTRRRRSSARRPRPGAGGTAPGVRPPPRPSAPRRRISTSVGDIVQSTFSGDSTSSLARRRRTSSTRSSTSGVADSPELDRAGRRHRPAGLRRLLRGALEEYGDDTRAACSTRRRPIQRWATRCGRPRIPTSRPRPSAATPSCPRLRHGVAAARRAIGVASRAAGASQPPRWTTSSRGRRGRPAERPGSSAGGWPRATAPMRSWPPGPRGRPAAARARGTGRRTARRARRPPPPAAGASRRTPRRPASTAPARRALAQPGGGLVGLGVAVEVGAGVGQRQHEHRRVEQARPPERRPPSAGSVTSQYRAVGRRRRARRGRQPWLLPADGARRAASSTRSSTSGSTGRRSKAADHAPRRTQLGELHRGASGPGAHRSPA